MGLELAYNDGLFYVTLCIYINMSGILKNTIFLIYMVKDKRNIFSDECSKLDAIYFEMRTNISKKISGKLRKELIIYLEQHPLTLYAYIKQPSSYLWRVLCLRNSMTKICSLIYISIRHDMISQANDVFPKWYLFTMVIWS